MRRAVLVLAVAGLLAAPAVVASAQEDLGLAVDAEDHPEMRLSVDVPAELHGVELDAEAFTVTEDGDDREVTVTSAATDPFTVVLAIDTSGSMGVEPMAAARDAAIAFVERMPAGSRIGVVDFAATAEVIIAPTDDHDAVATTIEGMEASGETALYEAVLVSLDELAGAERQAVVVLSDGGDNPHPDTEDPPDLDETLEAVEGAPATLHTIELVTDATEPEILEALAEAGDGSALSAEDPDALADVYAEVADQLVDRYELTYTSAAEGPTEVAVTVEHGDVSASASEEVELPALPVAEEPEDEAPAVAPPPTAQVSVGWFGSTWALVLGGALLYAGLFALLLVLLSPSERRAQLAGAGGGRGLHRPELGGLAERATQLAERGLARGGRGRRLDAALERAGLDLRSGEFVVLGVCAAIVAFAAGFALANVWVGLILAAAAYPVCRIVLRHLARRRQAAFADQLDDTLQLLAGSLRAGYGLIQAIDTVSREAPSPTSDEFKRVVVETRLGRSVGDALEAAARRIDSEDFWWVVQAMEIHREVGGDLAEVLDNVAHTIRERNHVRGQVKALSAEGRLSAIILVALPFVVAGAVFLLNPGYLAELTTHVAGIAMAVAAALLMLVGIVWLRRVVRLVY